MNKKDRNYNKANNLRWKKLMYLGGRIGCHQMPERSFFIHGYQFPLCARCTGLLIGYIISIATWYLVDISPLCSAIICIPLVVDGITQYIHWRESNQVLRLITGVLCGVGSVRLEIMVIIMMAKLI